MRSGNLLILFGTIILLTSCGLPKHTLELIHSRQKEFVEFPVDYAIKLPALTMKQWDDDYNTFEKYLTRDIMRTQVGLSGLNNGVQTWWCFPSARTHAQLDTTTMIKEKRAIIGEWRIISHRRITFEDSVAYKENIIYRTSRLNENYDDDAYLRITGTKFSIYSKEKEQNNFRRIGNKNYKIESQRYLMLYGISKVGAAISQIGLTGNGYLIINSNYVQERKVKGNYIVYQATVTQMIYERMAY